MTVGTPNQHNEMQRAICGGIVQEEGMRESLDALIEMVAVTALYYARLFQFNDLFEDLSQRFAAINRRATTSRRAPPQWTELAARNRTNSATCPAHRCKTREVNSRQNLEG
jgi:hypothetical protein